MAEQDGYELFFGKDSPFSQHHKCVFNVDGIRFCCTEQYMMYNKADVFKDERIKEKVLQSSQPAEIKHLGREVENFDILIWMKYAVDIVKTGNRAKFLQNSPLKNDLFKTYPRQLVEASPSDTRWGIGLATLNPAARDERYWRGRNLLGKLLTNLRDELMLEAKMIERVTMPTLESDQSGVEKELLERPQKPLEPTNKSSNKHFEFFWKKDSPYSNCHECEFIVDDVPFISMEQYMLYSKADLFKDDDKVQVILESKTQRQLSQIDSNVRGFNPNVWWNNISDIYWKGIKAKFTQNVHLETRLVSTFPKVILRVTWREQEKLISHPDNFSRQYYEENHWREFIIMDVRDEILSNKNGKPHSWRQNVDSHSESKRKQRQSIAQNKRTRVQSQKGSQDQDYLNNCPSPEFFSSAENSATNRFDLLASNKEQTYHKDGNSATNRFDLPTSNKEQIYKDGDGRSNQRNCNDPKQTSRKTKLPTVDDTDKAVEESGTNAMTYQDQTSGCVGEATAKDDKPGSVGEATTQDDKPGSVGEATTKSQQPGSAGEPTTNINTNVKTPSKQQPGKAEWQTQSRNETKHRVNKRDSGDTKQITGKQNDRNRKNQKQKANNSSKREKKEEEEDGNKPVNAEERNDKYGGIKKQSASCDTEAFPEKNKSKTVFTTDFRSLSLDKLEGRDKYTLFNNDSPLSTSFICKFKVDEKHFISVDHYVTYRKAVLFNDTKTMDKVFTATGVRDIKEFNSGVRNYDANEWFAVAPEEFKEGCKLKFQQNKELKKLLFDTYPTILTETPKPRGANVRLVDMSLSDLDEKNRKNKLSLRNVLVPVRDQLMKEEDLID